MKGTNMAEKEYKPTFYERCLLHNIIIMSNKYGQYYQTNDTIADMFNIGVKSVSVMLSHLLKNGFLIRNKEGGKRFLQYTGKNFDKIPLFMNLNKMESVCAINKSKKLTKINSDLVKENEELKKKIASLEKELLSVQNARVL